MTADTLVKMTKSENCAPEVTGYDGQNSLLTATVILCCDNGDVKHNLVFVNDSTGVSSDDSIEHQKDVLVNIAADKLSVEGGGGGKVNGDVESDELDNNVEVDREDLKVENGVGVSGGDLVEENGEIKLESEVVELENDGSGSNVEGELDVSFRVSEVEEVSDPEPVVDQLKEGSVTVFVLDPKPDENEVDEVLETGGNGSAYINGVASRSLDVDENRKDSVSDAEESAAVEAQDSTHSTAEHNVYGAAKLFEIELQADIAAAMEVAEIELLAEHHIVFPLDNGIEIQGAETETLGYQVVIPEVNENDVQGGIDSLAGGGSHESVDSESAECELGQVENVEIANQTGLDLFSESEETPESLSLPNHSQGVLHYSSNLESPGMENPVSDSAGQSDESLTDLSVGDENNNSVVTSDTDSETTDTSAVSNELEKVDGDAESEVTAESGDSQEASLEVGVLQDQVSEQSRSFDVVDKEISPEDCSSEKSLTVDDTTSVSELQSTDDTATDPDQSRHVIDCVIPKSDWSSEDSLSSVRCGDIYFGSYWVAMPAPCDSDILNERRVGDDVSSVADNFASSWADECDDTCSWTKLENSSCSNTETVSNENGVAIKSNNILDGPWMPTISFGSLEFVTPFSIDDIELQSDVLNKSSAVSANTSEYKHCPENNASSLNPWVDIELSDLLNNNPASAQVTPLQQNIEVSASSVEGSEADSFDEHEKNPDMVTKPVYWLVKVPRGDLGGYSEQLRQSERDLAEKTATKNAFQDDHNKQQACCRELRNSLEAAKSEARAAQELVRAKRREVDSAHSIINLAKNGVTVDDLDKKIHNLEHILQHETHILREERELVREIRKLTHQRQQSSADPQRQQEILQARDQKDHALEQLKVLKKDMEALRDDLIKAEARVRAAQKKYDDGSALLTDLKRQVRSANDIRQEAYVHTMTLRKELREKNALFYNARRVAYNYAAAGEKESLERHCANQVEAFIEIWNENDKFRQDYIESNKRNMLWKFGTLDGTQCGVNEAPPSLVDVSSPTLMTAEGDPPVAQDMEEKTSKKEEKKKATPVTEKNEASKVSSRIQIEEDKEPELTKEEEELARKAEQLRREEEAARLREKQKLEEKAKAEKALERRRLNALKDQARAERRAQQEAEQKEKKREKRAKKKEKKIVVNPEITENEPAQPSEPVSNSVKDPEVAEKPAVVAKRPRKASLQTKQVKIVKPIPVAIRNKNKRGLLRYWPSACIMLLAIASVYFGSFERIHAIKRHISGLLLH
ncbi:hypothetical protein vseg_016691 [Gypsophila vaccaria]